MGFAAGMRFLGWILVGIVCAWMGSGSIVAAESFEKPPIFEASKILKPEIYKSTIHQVAEKVINDGYSNSFTIDSRFGQYSARGLMTLEDRIHEIAVLDALEREYPSTKVAGDAVYNTGKGIVTAPVRAVSKAVDHVSDTEKLKKLPKQVVGGIAGIFTTAAELVGTGAEFVYESGKSLVKGGDGSSSSSGSGSTFSQASAFLEKSALDFIGYNQAAKDLMKRHSIDPYTDNKLLRSEIRRIAGITSGVSVAGKFAPGIPSIPFVGSFNKYMGLATDISAYDDPKKLDEISNKVLSKIGTSEGKNSDWAKRFRESPAYTPLTRALFLDNVSKLGEIPGLGNFVGIASDAEDRDGALFYVAVSQKLLQLHREKGPFKEVIAALHLPGGLAKDGTLFIPLAVDYLVWTKEVAQIFRSFKKQLLERHKVSKGVVVVSGSVSPRCKKELASLGAMVVEKSGSFLVK